jgi:hypothetical protein
VVANVGDSRGVMCDSKGNAIPLSFDHKPQQVLDCHMDLCVIALLCAVEPPFTFHNLTFSPNVHIL